MTELRLRRIKPKILTSPVGGETAELLRLTLNSMTEQV